MKVNKNIEAIIVTLLYLTCLYFWTLPIQKNPVPYGEVDAASHYSVADYTYQKDKSITTLPFYIDKRYGRDNNFKQHTLWYPPPFHMGLAIAAVFGGESDFPILIANAIFCSLIVLSVYFIIRRFFGFEAALLSGFLLIFSMRDIMVFLWGQWPERMGYAYVPLILYCFYKYCSSYLRKEEKPIYLYIMSLLLAVNLFIHPMDFFHSVMGLIVVSLFFLIKEKKLFFNVKYVFASVLLFLLIISIFPLQTLSVIVKLQGGKGEPQSMGRISRLFYWFKPTEHNYGVPPAYFSYKAMIGPYWTIPLIFLGILFLLLRRNKKDLVMLGWLASLYVMIHLDFIGKGRIHRSLSATAHIFYPLMVLGLIYIFSLIPMLKRYKTAVKSILAILFAVFMFMSIGVEAHKTLKGAYSGILRVNPYQYDLLRWIRQSDNVPADSSMYQMGAISQPKNRWMWMMGHRYILQGDGKIPADIMDYVIMDYSDFVLMGDQNTINNLLEWEKQNLANNTLIYNTDYIRVYKI